MYAGTQRSTLSEFEGIFFPVKTQTPSIQMRVDLSSQNYAISTQLNVCATNFTAHLLTLVSFTATKEVGENEAGTVYDFKDKCLKEQIALYKEKRIKLFAPYRMPV